MGLSASEHEMIKLRYFTEMYIQHLSKGMVNGLVYIKKSLTNAVKGVSVSISSSHWWLYAGIKCLGCQ